MSGKTLWLVGVTSTMPICRERHAALMALVAAGTTDEMATANERECQPAESIMAPATVATSAVLVFCERSSSPLMNQPHFVLVLPTSIASILLMRTAPFGRCHR